MKHFLLVQFETNKPINDMTDKIADRIYRMDGINHSKDVIVSVIADPDKDSVHEYIESMTRPHQKKEGQ